MNRYLLSLFVQHKHVHYYLQLSRNEDEKLMRILLTLLISSLLAALPSQQIQNNMSPASNNNNAIKSDSDDVASYGNVLRLRFPSMPMRSSTPFFVEAQTDANANDFTDLEGNHRNSNSSEAEAGSNEFANVGADSNSSNGHEKGQGQEVERRVSGGGDGGDPPPMDIDLQFDSSSSDASSHPSNDYQLRDSRGKRWFSNTTVLWSFIVLLIVCTTVIISRQNVVITDLENKFSSLEKKYLSVTSKPRSQSKQAKNKNKGSEKEFVKVKGKTNKDECCACLSTSSVRLLSNVHFTLSYDCIVNLNSSSLLFSFSLLVVHMETAIDKSVSL